MLFSSFEWCSALSCSSASANTYYHNITNASAAAYNMVGGNYASGTSAAGADVKVLALGMIHNF
jgi:hypothetical protein